MALTKYRFGDLIKQRREKYSGNELLPICGVSQDGFIPPKQVDADTSIYNIFYRNDFVFNPARMELNSIAFNNTFDKAMCSSLYEIFYITRQDIVLPEYLNLFIKREEFARKCWFEAVGSARNYFRVPALSEFEIQLPSITTQRKYIDIYNAILANQKSYERGLENLKLVCDGYIEDLRRRIPCTPIGKYIAKSTEKNSNGAITLEQGINIEKQFTTPQRSNDNFFGRQIVRTGQIAYCTQLNNENVAVALRTGPDCIVSSVYDVIYVKDKTVLLPEYLMLWLSRAEFGRYVYWASQGTSYEFLSYDNLAGYRIPVPDIQVQKSIVNVYNVYIKRITINKKLKAKIKGICPVLIKGSLEEEK